MNNQKLQNFIDLVTFDQNFIKLESSISSTEKNVITLRDQLKESQSVYEDKINEHKEAKKKLDLQELEVKALQEKEQRQAEVIQKASNPREHDAAQHELETLQVQRDTQEKKLMQLWNLHENLEKEVEAIRVQQDEKQQEIQESINKENDLLEKLQKDLKDHNQQRTTKAATVPEEWINLYDHMRGRVTDPVVSIAQDSCSACFNIVSSKDLQALKHGELVQCKDCYRFLYEDQDNNKEQ